MASASTVAPSPWFSAARYGAFALVVFVYFVRLGAGTLWDNSEPTYGEIVKEMFRTGDWLSLHFNYQPWFVHPPLWFWTAALAARIFGLDEFALRLPSAVFGVLAALAVYRAGVRLYGEAAGLIAAVAYATCLETIVISRLAILDAMLACFMTVATLWGYFAVRDEDARAFWIAVVAAAAGVLVKGPVAVVLPLASLLVWVAWCRRWQRLAGLPWLAGSLAFLALAGWWFVAVTIKDGGAFLDAYFGASTFGRYLHPFENQPGPFWYYVPVLLLGFFPYVAFLPKAIKEAWLARADDERFIFAAAIVPFVFFSLAQTKLPNYILISLPACALLVGRMLAAAIESNRLRPLRGALLMLPASIALVAGAMIWYGRTHYLGEFTALVPSMELLGWVVGLASLATFVATLAYNRVWLAPVGMAAMMAAFIGVLAIGLLPLVERFKPMKSMAATAMQHWRPGTQLGITGPPGGFSLLFYTDGGSMTNVGERAGVEPPQVFFDTRHRVLAFISPPEFPVFTAYGIKLRVLRKEPKIWLVTNQP